MVHVPCSPYKQSLHAFMGAAERTKEQLPGTARLTPHSLDGDTLRHCTVAWSSVHACSLDVYVETCSWGRFQLMRTKQESQPRPCKQAQSQGCRAAGRACRHAATNASDTREVHPSLAARPIATIASALLVCLGCSELDNKLPPCMVLRIQANERAALSEQLARLLLSHSFLFLANRKRVL